MAYTWTTGEVITAEKLNNTGSGYDAVFTYTHGDNPTLTGEGLSVSEIISKVESLELPKIHVNYIDETLNERVSSDAISIKKYMYDSTPGLYIYGNNDGGAYILIGIDGEYGADTVLIKGAFFTYTYDSTTKEYTFAFDHWAD